MDFKRLVAAATWAYDDVLIRKGLDPKELRETYEKNYNDTCLLLSDYEFMSNNGFVVGGHENISERMRSEIEALAQKKGQTYMILELPSIVPPKQGFYCNSCSNEKDYVRFVVFVLSYENGEERIESHVIRISHCWNYDYERYGKPFFCADDHFSLTELLTKFGGMLNKLLKTFDSDTILRSIE